MTKDISLTIEEISKILKDSNLKFLGFTFPRKYPKSNFFKVFMEDKHNIFLKNWHQFEVDNPDIFERMYPFWVRKIL